jgi:hypothetical protein
MIYSQWQPEGGFKYFETPEKLPIGNDIAGLITGHEIKEIGVPAQEVGRALPGGAREVGRGNLPVGLMLAVSGGSLGGAELGGAKPVVWWQVGAAGLAAAAFGYWLGKNV